MQHTLLLCVETALNMQRMANIVNLLTLEQKSNMQSLGQKLGQHVVAYTPCWSYVDQTIA